MTDSNVSLNEISQEVKDYADANGFSWASVAQLIEVYSESRKRWKKPPIHGNYTEWTAEEAEAVMLTIIGERANLVSAAGDTGKNQETGECQAQHSDGNIGSPATDTLNDCRSAFEAWAGGDGNWASDFELLGNGFNYHDDATEYLWQAWQGAWNARAQTNEVSLCVPPQADHSQREIPLKIDEMAFMNGCDRAGVSFECRPDARAFLEQYLIALPRESEIPVISNDRAENVLANLFISHGCHEYKALDYARQAVSYFSMFPKREYSNHWQPIEIAIKDENADAILVRGKGSYAVCTWYEPVQKWMFCQTGNTFVFFDGATEWMSLSSIEGQP